MIDLIRYRLLEYQAGNLLEEEHALKEIVQEIILFGLWQANFFKVAAFQGGTSLRILHGLTRFSEDLDFILLEENPTFIWQPYLDSLMNTCKDFGITPVIIDKNKMDSAIRSALIKDTSIANQLNLSFINSNSSRSLKIKLEVDSHPPTGSGFDYTYLDFPMDFEVYHQDLSSNFSLKIHALLCRDYVKGRDWYDFNRYVARRVFPNLPLLESALDQYGPWKGKRHQVTDDWLKEALADKIASINWNHARADVVRFVKPVEQKSLSLWGEAFFLSKLDKFSL